MNIEIASVPKRPGWSSSLYGPAIHALRDNGKTFCGKQPDTRWSWVFDDEQYITCKTCKRLLAAKATSASSTPR